MRTGDRMPGCGDRAPAGSNDAPGLYVHLPLCRTKCPYCDFFSVTEHRRRRGILDALHRELELGAGSFRHAAIDTVYLGGGTPSLLLEEEIGRLLEGIRRTFPIAPGAEVTLEVNPDDVTRELLEAWRDAGINRLSLGLQSLDEAELSFLGRRHSVRQGRSSYDLARSTGFENVGADLIFGCPPGDIKRWRRTLTETLALRPDHLSCYLLTVEDHTPLGRDREAGRWTEIDETRARKLFLTAHDILGEAGYEHYEVSNYSRGREHRSKHNQKYWRRVPYLGVGPSAHSFDGRRRWWNCRSLDEYIAALSAAEAALPVAGEEVLTPDQVLLEELMLGFRTVDGIDLAVFRQRPGWMEICEALLEQGLVRLAADGRRIASTVEGLLVADGLPLRFFPIAPGS